MKAQGNVMFKCIQKRDGGVFRNESGSDIKYDASYVVLFDENINGVISEKKLKFPASDLVLYEKFSRLKPYTNVNITCDVILSTNSCKLVVKDVLEVK